jgi:Ca2+-binding RTX toxin-like protein
LSDAVIENITAGTQGGTFTGNSLANILTGGAGSDTLNGGNGDDLLIGNAGNDILNGGLQNDVYQFDVDLVLGSDTINDTLGVDALDFALTTTVGITLDLAVTSLQALHATNLSLTLSVGTVIETVLGTAKDDTIRGNDADNILVGNAGNDVLQGRAGRDILIGGLGADTLDGGANDDILIGGKTTSDAVINKLNDIRTEWISANWYGIRLANLRAGVGASNTSLKAKVNVTNDATSGSVDTLTGGSDEDWYFKAVDDIVTDLFAGEFLDLL